MIEHASFTIDRAADADAADLAALAAVTFPLACPPGVRDADVHDYIDRVLSAERFGGYLADPDRTVLLARDRGAPAAYAMLIHTPPADEAIAAVIPAAPATEISKFYAHPSAHSTGLAAELMRGVLTLCSERGDGAAWLGVNQENARAQRFYRKQGFDVVGVKTFTMGADLHDDFVMARVMG